MFQVQTQLVIYDNQGHWVASESWVTMFESKDGQEATNRLVGYVRDENARKSKPGHTNTVSNLFRISYVE